MGKFDRFIHFLSSTQVKIYTSPKANLGFMATNHLHTSTVDNDRTLLYDHSRDTLSLNKMLSSYVNNGRLEHAHKMFDEMPVKDVVSWNTMLMGLRKSGDPHRVYTSFVRMLRGGFSPSGHTISIVLSAVLGAEFKVLVLQLHGLSVRLALTGGLFVGSSLIRGYADVGDTFAMKKVFDGIYEKDVSSWNALVSGYMRLGLVVEAQRVFNTMPERNVVSWTSLINGYVSAKQISKARCLFDKMSEKNVVSWTAMISGYVQSQGFLAALELFVLMLRSGVQPNAFTFSTVLVACTSLCSLLVGQQVHSSVLRHGTRDDVVLSSSLVDMYAKCGDVEAAFQVFEAIHDKNMVAWNAIIGGYARHGLAVRALEEFERMMRSEVGPDHVTFVNVLTACVHRGLVEEGEKLFSLMKLKYGIRVGSEHYACMVDLYGRAGMMEKAAKLIEEMPVEPDVVVWGALLAGSGTCSGLERVEKS